MQLHTYFNFDGNCREAFQLYHQVLGGTITAMMTWREGPYAENASPDIQDKIMHASLDLDGHILMGSDSTPQYPYEPVRSANVVVTVADAAEAERVFQELSQGGSVGMALTETFWADRFGTVVDRFGVPWMVNCSKQEA